MPQKLETAFVELELPQGRVSVAARREPQHIYYEVTAPPDVPFVARAGLQLIEARSGGRYLLREAINR
jgi:hypothetical protein